MKQELLEELNEICDTQRFYVGLSFYDIKNEIMFDRFGNCIVPSASTRKIFILGYVLKMITSGKLKLNDIFTLDIKYKDTNSGLFRHFTNYPIKISLHDALISMIAVSDNSCTGLIVDIIGIENVDKYLKSIGIKNTCLRFGYLSSSDKTKYSLSKTNVTTPNDILLMLRYFYDGSLSTKAANKIGLSVELCKLALSILQMQQFNDRLPFLLPKNASVAHKTGTRENGLSDAGIIYKNNIPLFILAIYTYNVPEKINDTPGKAVASEVISRICKICFDYLSI